VTETDRKRIDAALLRAQAGTSARIAVRIVPDRALDAFERAKSEFVDQGLHAHGAANAAPILVAPKACAFAVIGDRNLHERVGQAFWDETVGEMTKAFATRTPTDAIVLGVDRLGAAFHEHFTETQA
jgi:uncharacterized membrane protein